MDGEVAGTGKGTELVSTRWEVLFSPARRSVRRPVGLSAADDIVMLAVRVPGRAG